MIFPAAVCQVPQSDNYSEEPHSTPCRFPLHLSKPEMTSSLSLASLHIPADVHLPVGACLEQFSSYFGRVIESVSESLFELSTCKQMTVYNKTKTAVSKVE